MIILRLCSESPSFCYIYMSTEATDCCETRICLFVVNFSGLFLKSSNSDQSISDSAIYMYVSYLFLLLCLLPSMHTYLPVVYLYHQAVFVLFGFLCFNSSFFFSISLLIILFSLIPFVNLN